MLKALEPRRVKIVEGCGFTVGSATRRYLGEIRAIFTLDGYENESRADALDDDTVVDGVRCTGPEKITLMFTYTWKEVNRL